MYKIKLDIFLKHSLLGGPRSEGHYHLPMCPSQQPGHPSFPHLSIKLAIMFCPFCLPSFNPTMLLQPQFSNSS